MARKATFLLLGSVALSALASPASAQTRQISVDAGKVIGTVRPGIQGVNQVPLRVNRPNSPDLRKQFRDLGITSARTHDTAGPTDIDAFRKGKPLNGIIFPNWDADPEDPESYVFGPSDQIIAGILDSGAEVYFRIGRTYDSDPFRPPDFDKYASVVKHIAMHYNDGWAGGGHYNIRYWEFWNEPDVASDWGPLDNPMVGANWTVNWPAPINQFYSLYEKVAQALKGYDPKLKVGCCALSRGQSSSPYREGLIQFAAKKKVPLDFYSWHHYGDDASDPWDFVRIARQVRELLDSNSFYNAEVHCTEWDLSLTPATRGPHPQARNSMEAAAWVATSLIYMQDAPLEIAQYETGPSLFERDGTYRKKAHVFKATGAMLKTPQRLAVAGADTIGFGVLAGRSQDGKTVQVLIGNYEIADLGSGPPMAIRPPNVPVMEPRLGIEYKDNRGYSMTLTNLPWGQREFSVKRYRVTDTENFDLVGETSGEGGTFVLSNPLTPPAVELIVLEQK
jgi:xylan 1,4-beta-xylosidase